MKEFISEQFFGYFLLLKKLTSKGLNAACDAIVMLWHSVSLFFQGFVTRHRNMSLSIMFITLLIQVFPVLTDQFLGCASNLLFGIIGEIVAFVSLGCVLLVYGSYVMYLRYSFVGHCHRTGWFRDHLVKLKKDYNRCSVCYEDFPTSGVVVRNPRCCNFPICSSCLATCIEQRGKCPQCAREIQQMFPVPEFSGDGWVILSVRSNSITRIFYESFVGDDDVDQDVVGETEFLVNVFININPRLPEQMLWAGIPDHVKTKAIRAMARLSILFGRGIDHDGFVLVSEMPEYREYVTSFLLNLSLDRVRFMVEWRRAILDDQQRRRDERVVFFGPENVVMDEVFFGPENRPEDFVDIDESPSPVHVVDPNPIPDTDIVDNNINRKTGVKLASYNFPIYTFLGLWNVDIYTDKGRWFNDHFGVFLVGTNHRVVVLPSTLVDELGVFWAGRERTRVELCACFAVTKQWLKNVTGITSQQYSDAANYAPVISMLRSDEERQNIQRVADLAYGSRAQGMSGWFFDVLRMFDVIGGILIVLLCVFMNTKVPNKWVIFHDYIPFCADNIADVLVHTANVAVSAINLFNHYFQFEKPLVDCGYWMLSPGWRDLVTCDTNWLIFQDVQYMFVILLSCILVLVSMIQRPFLLTCVVLEDIGRLVVYFLLKTWRGCYYAYQINLLSGLIGDVYYVRDLSFWWYVLNISYGMIEGFLLKSWNSFVYHVVFALAMLDSRIFAHLILIHVIHNFCVPHDKWFFLPGVIRRAILSARSFNLTNLIYEVKSRPDGKVVYPNPLTQHRSEIRRQQFLYGLGSGGYRPVAYGATYTNEKSAIAARIMVETPQPDRMVVGEAIKWIKTNLKKLIPTVRIDSVSFNDYIRNSNASPAVKRILVRTKIKMDQDGIDENSILTPNQLYSWTCRKAFVKVENNVYRTPGGRKKKACRLIQGAPPEFICLVGPWIMSLQTYFKYRWGKKSNLCFTSGMSALEAASVVNRPGWKILEDDIGAFDASVDPCWLKLELWIFKKFGCPVAVSDLIKANISTHGVTMHGIRYKRDGMRKSGDPYTSLGNTMLNILMHVHIYCRETNSTPGQAKQTLQMLAAGDDNLMVYNSDCEINWVSEMKKFGFNSEAVFRESIYDAEFCSNTLYDSDKGLVFAPLAGKVMAKLGYYINPPMNVHPLSLVRGTALGLYNSCQVVPPLRAYLDAILLKTDGIVPHKIPFEEWKMKYDPCSSVPETWVTLDRRYGWTHFLQSSLEEGLENAVLGEEFINTPMFLLCDRDTAGPQAMYLKNPAI